MPISTRRVAVVFLTLAVLTAIAALVAGGDTAFATSVSSAPPPGQTPAAPTGPQVNYEFVEGGSYTTNDCAATLRVYVEYVPSTYPAWYDPTGNVKQALPGSGACSNVVRIENRSDNGMLVSVDYPFYIRNQTRTPGHYKAMFLGFTAYFDIAPYTPPTPTPTPVYTDAVSGHIVDIRGGAVAGAKVAAFVPAWVTRSFGGKGDLAAVDCPTAAKCEAVGDGGILLGSLDGGATWHMQEFVTLDSLVDVSCPSATTCYALGASGTFLATTDGGSHWSNQTPAPADLQSLSCPAADTCFAAGYDLFARTTDGGATWATSSRFTDAPHMISCPTTTACFVAGAASEIAATTNAGATWTNKPTGAPVDYFSALVCPSETTCFAAGQRNGRTTIPLVAVTTNRGTTWTNQALPSAIAGRVGGLSCASGSACTLVEKYGPTYASTDGGVTWQAGSPLATNSLAVTALNCPTTAACVAVGEGGMVATYGLVKRYQAISDAAGNYTLERVAPNTYALSATRPGYTFSPAARSVAVPPSATGQDFAGELMGSALYLPVIVRTP